MIKKNFKLKNKKLCLILFISGWLALILLYNLKNYFVQKEEYVKEKTLKPIDKHSVKFMGKRFCHPGYFGDKCNLKYTPANPWYTKDCPNLDEEFTYHPNMPLRLISNGKECPGSPESPLNKCAYLCFSHPKIGVAQIPKSLWKLFQQHKVKNWIQAIEDDHRREHLEGFDNYKNLPSNLGNFMEVGCGPFTHTLPIINRKFESITLLDPLANYYIDNMEVCKYKNGRLLDKPVKVLNIAAELLNEEHLRKYDTIMSVDVIENVLDSFKFLTNIYQALKPGGILIYHDRYYTSSNNNNANSGGGSYPIRLKREIFELFFKQFTTIYMFEGQTKAQMERNLGEVGFYFIGKKSEF